jgi:hypothetical protein
LRSGPAEAGHYASATGEWLPRNALAVFERYAVSTRRFVFELSEFLIRVKDMIPVDKKQKADTA